MLLVEKFLLDGIFLLGKGWFCRTSFSTLVAQMWTGSTEASAEILYCTGDLARQTCVQEFIENEAGRNNICAGLSHRIHLFPRIV